MGNRNLNLPSLHWLNRLSFSYFFCIGVQINFLPSLYFTSPRVLSGEVGGEGCAKAGSVILLLPFWFVCDAGSCGGGSGHRRRAVLHLVDAAGAELVDPVGINPVDPALVKVDEEHHIWRAGKKKNKTKQIINGSTAHRPPPPIACGRRRRTVSETAYPVHHGHLDDEGKQVVDKRVERFIREHPPGQMGHGLQFVVDEQLRRHSDEALNPPHPTEGERKKKKKKGRC